MIGTRCHYSGIVDRDLDDGGSFLASHQGGAPEFHLLGDWARVQVTHVSPRAGVQYSRIDLTPGDVPVVDNALPVDPSLRRLSLIVERRATAAVTPGDRVSIVRTGAGGTGLSVVRRGALVLGAGALVGGLELGDEVAAGIPFDAVEAAEELFKARDPEFSWYELPVEVRVRRRTTLLFRGRRVVEGHEIFVTHGAYRGLPGIDACLSVTRLDFNLSATAAGTALLLDRKRPEGLG